jgi:hypothetical protein
VLVNAAAKCAARISSDIPTKVNHINLIEFVAQLATKPIKDVRLNKASISEVSGLILEIVLRRMACAKLMLVHQCSLIGLRKRSLIELRKFCFVCLPHISLEVSVCRRINVRTAG